MNKRTYKTEEEEENNHNDIIPNEKIVEEELVNHCQNINEDSNNLKVLSSF